MYATRAMKRKGTRPLLTISWSTKKLMIGCKGNPKLRPERYGRRLEKDQIYRRFPEMNSDSLGTIKKEDISSQLALCRQRGPVAVDGE